MQDISPAPGPAIAPVEQHKPKPPPVAKSRNFNPVKYLQKTQHRYSRKWDQICGEKTFQKSLLVEDKFPYFKSKPKIPFGMKDSNELNMRIGINQDSRPVKVLDKVNGVFTCTICDVVILDRYSLQDHWYSAKHKQNMKLVQVTRNHTLKLSYSFQSEPIRGGTSSSTGLSSQKTHVFLLFLSIRSLLVWRSESS